MGVCVDPETDHVSLRGREVTMSKRLVTVMLHKPAGYVTTSRDQFGRPDVCQLVKIPGLRLYPVGRLDYQTTGLLLLTNDGELTYRMTFPGFHMAKTYEALLRGKVNEADLKPLEKGVKLEDGYRTAPAKAKVLRKEKENTWISLTIYEGKYHQVRRMAKAIKHPVLRLKRVQEGSLKLGNLPVGAYRELTEEELESLKNDLQNKGKPV